MATLYELLSSKPKVEPGRCRNSLDWTDPDLESRDYVMPVRHGQVRPKVQRTRKIKSVTYGDMGEKDPEKVACTEECAGATEEAHGSQSTALITQLATTKYRPSSDYETRSLSDHGKEPTAVNEYDDTKSIASSCLRPEPGPAPPDYGDIEYVRQLYAKKCDKCSLVPMGIFLRQIGQPDLDLHFNCIGNDGMKSLAAPIAMSPNLSAINLNTTNLGDEAVIYLIEALLQKEGIRDLDVSDNKITSKGGVAICELITRSKSLRKLNLSGNVLGDAFTKSLSEALQDTYLLAELNLEGCGLGIEAGKNIGPALANNDSVTDLNLSWNHIRLEGAIAVANGLKRNLGIIKLNISWNGFSWDGSEALGEALIKNNNLTHLDMSNNRLFDKGVFKLIKGLQKNQALQTLIVNANPISPEGAVGLLKAVEKNPATAMTRLELQGVPIKDEFLKTLENVKEKNPDFEVVFENTRGSGDKKTATDILFDYLYEEKKTLQDIFGLTEGELFMNKGAFIEQVMDAKTPLTESHVLDICSFLIRKDGTVLALGYLFRRWDAYLEERNSREQEN